jgi:hypothetical protein
VFDFERSDVVRAPKGITEWRNQEATMHRSATIVAIAGAALAVACNRPAGEESAADQQEHKPEVEPLKPIGAAPEPRAEQPAAPQDQQRPAPQAAQPRAGEQPVPGAMRIVEITTDPDAHMRKTVIVVGEVEDMLASRAFTLSDETAPGKAGQDSDVMVLGKDDASWKIEEAKGDARWRVEGRLQRIPAANLEKQLGWKPDERVQNEIDGETVVLIAERVERIEGAQADERQDVRGEDAPEN